MSKDDRYNGWANYPTWAAYTWITSDEDTYRGALAALREQGDAPAEFALGPYVQSLLPDTGASMASDLIEWALEHVDWDAVVGAIDEDFGG